MDNREMGVLYFPVAQSHVDSRSDLQKIMSLTPLTIVKEVGQNSFDVKLNNDSPVRVRFELMELPKSLLIESLKKIGLNDIDTFKTNLKAMKNVVDTLNKSKYQNLIDILEGNTDRKNYYFLVISDFNAEGLTGDDVFKVSGKSNFHQFNYKLGMSTKEGKLGSYGEGRLAILSLSKLQFVFQVSNLSDQKNMNRYFGMGILSPFEDHQNHSGYFYYQKDQDETRSMTTEEKYICEFIPPDRYEQFGTTLIYPIVNFSAIDNIPFGEDDVTDDNIEYFLNSLKKNAEDIFFTAIANNEIKFEYFFRKYNTNTKSFIENIVEYSDVASLHPYYKLLSGLELNIEENFQSKYKIHSFNTFIEIPLEKKRTRYTYEREEITLKIIDFGNIKRDEVHNDFRAKLDKILYARSGMIIMEKSIKSILKSKVLAFVNIDKEKSPYAHEFLTTSEPPSHDRWMITSPKVAEKYRGAGRKKIREFFDRVENEIEKNFGWNDEGDKLDDLLKRELFGNLGTQNIDIEKEILLAKRKKSKKRKTSTDDTSSGDGPSPQPPKKPIGGQSDKIISPSNPMNDGNSDVNEEYEDDTLFEDDTLSEDEPRLNRKFRMPTKFENNNREIFIISNPKEGISNIELEVDVYTTGGALGINKEKILLPTTLIGGSSHSDENIFKSEDFPIKGKIDFSRIPKHLRELIDVRVRVTGRRAD